MALKVQGTTVVDDSRELQNIASIDSGSATVIQNALTISGGGASVATTTTAPSSPTDGDLWWDSESTELFIYYDDGATAQWVATTPATGSLVSLLDLSDVGTDGTSGQVLTTDGAGNFSFTTISGGSAAAATYNTLGTIYGSTEASGGNNTTYLGYNSGKFATDGTDNTAVGLNALWGLKYGSRNSAFGRAFTMTSAGIQAAGTTIDDNTAIGTSAFNNPTGLDPADGTTPMATSWNIAVGNNALTAFEAGSENTGMGGLAGRYLTSGSWNTFIGCQAGAFDELGNNITTATDCIALGRGARLSSNNVNSEITLGSPNINRFRIPGLDLDTNDATDGQVLAWNSTNAGFVWTTPATGGGGSYDQTLNTTDSVEFVALELSDPSKLTVPLGSQAPSFVINAGAIGSGPFSTAMHDWAAFASGNYTVTQETYDGISWNADTLQKGLFAQQKDTTYNVINVGDSNTAIRWTWSGSDVPYSSIDYFLIGVGYTGLGTNTIDLTIESSADSGTTWTTQHSTTDQAISSSTIVLPCGNWGGHSTIRLTIAFSASSVNTSQLPLTNISLMSDRPGSQGRGPEFQLPIQWDAERNVTAPGNLSVTNDLVVAGATALTTGNYSTELDNANLENFHVTKRLSGSQDLNDYSKLDSFIFESSPEYGAVIAPWLINELAYLRLRGGTAVVTNETLADYEFDYLFDGKSTKWVIATSETTNTAAAPQIELTLPEPLRNKTTIGIAFEKSSARAQGVKIEVYDNNAWVTAIDTSTNDDSYVLDMHQATSVPGITKIRITVWNPSNDDIRIAHIFAVDYDSALGKSLFVGRDGGDIYADVAVTGDVSMDTLTLGSKTFGENDLKPLSQFSMLTGGTGNTANQYWKIATMELTGQYHESHAIADMALRAGDHNVANARLEIGVKQGSALGNDPQVMIRQHIFHELDEYSFGYVVVQNTPTSIVDIYCKVHNAYSQVGGNIIINDISTTASDPLTFYNDKNVAGTTTQPTGYVEGEAVKYVSYGNPPLISGRIDGWNPTNGSTGKDLGAGFTVTSTGTGLYTVTLNSGSFGAAGYGITLNTEDSAQRVKILSRTTTSFSIEVTSGGAAQNAHVSFAAYRHA